MNVSMGESINIVYKGRNKTHCSLKIAKSKNVVENRVQENAGRNEETGVDLPPAKTLGADFLGLDRNLRYTGVKTAESDGTLLTWLFTGMDQISTMWAFDFIFSQTKLAVNGIVYYFRNTISADFVRMRGDINLLSLATE